MIRNILVIAVVGVVSGCDAPIEVGGESAAGVDSGSTGVANTVTNTEVRLGGYTLAPRSTAHVEAPNLGALLFVVSDHGNVCGTYKCRIATGGNAPGATRLEFVVVGKTPGTYSIAASQAGASLTFVKDDLNGNTLFRDEAATGAIWLDSYSPTGVATGRYDVTMTKGGEILRGNFSTEYCRGLGLTIGASGISCVGGGSGGSSGAATCSSSCTCDGKTVSAQCAVNGSRWDCTCTASDGGTTSYSPQSADAGMNACWAYAMPTSCDF